MNFCASVVITTCTSHLALVRSDAKSAALCAAIEPVTPRTTFIILAIIAAFMPNAILKARCWRPSYPHFFGFDNSQRQAQVFLFGTADKQIIEILPLDDFLPRGGDALANNLRRIRATTLKTIFNFDERFWRQENRHQCVLKL